MPSDKKKTILALEPYYGGSHKGFLDDLRRLVDASWQLCTLPARKWKWRMRLGAQHFAGHLKTVAAPDLVVCSSFMDVAALRGTGPRWLRKVPLVVYFHENQFAYPNTVDDPRDLHFGLTNLTCALAADRVAFNSQYNMETFLSGCRQVMGLASDAGMAIPGWEEHILAKARVLYPGMDYSVIDDAAAPMAPEGPPVILWNHRWEHDKGPERFFAALEEVRQRAVPFRLVVCGQSFQRRPEVFEQARQRFAPQVLHFGFAASRKEYAALLKQADVVVSTADHEFYGMAILEAVRAGCRPVLPARLSYPEIFPERFLYHDDSQLVDALVSAVQTGRLTPDEARDLTEPFSWNTLLPGYHSFFFPES